MPLISWAVATLATLKGVSLGAALALGAMAACRARRPGAGR
jgi:hypothetical protein